MALQERGASAFVVSALVLAELLPSVTLGPVLAPLLDRVDVSRIVSAALALRALIAIGIAPVPSEGGLLLLVAAAAAVSAVDSPAMALLVPTAVPAGRAVAVGYARSDTCRTIGALVGPAVAGFLVATVGTHATLLVDAGTFLLLLTIVLALRLRRPPERTPVTRTPWLRQVAAGPRTLFGDRVMAASVLALASAIVFTAMITVAEVFFIRQELGQPAEEDVTHLRRKILAQTTADRYGRNETNSLPSFHVGASRDVKHESDFDGDLEAERELEIAANQRKK